MIVSNLGAAAASPFDTENVVCIIRDLVDSGAGLSGKQSLNLQATVSARQAAKDIARNCGYRENSVSVHYEQQYGAEDISLEEQDEGVLLGDVCASGARRHNFTIHELEGTLPQKLENNVCFDETVDLAEKSRSHLPNLEIKFCFDVSNSQDDSTAGSSSSSIMRSETGYLGLVNQAMTCYLNSLLQTLFMTPEFRNALYRWNFDGKEEEKVKSIPYQLQRLFLQLQTCNKRSVETTDLTKSFGWDSSEVWQQHDVQELCRVMFDALEQQWKNTVQANLINQLYQGKMKDYVKCLECGYESARVDAYLDIPLVIRPFGSTEAYGSVREAMQAFVQPEILDGSNQYFCEKCNKKCNAHKGLKFVTFPYLLTLQLKRFDFDYATMHRIKLNDKVTFQEVLNLNLFISCETKTGEGALDEDEEEKLASLSANHVDSSDEGIDEGIELETGCSAGSSSSDSSSISSEAAANNSRNVCHNGDKGPYVYELFSIMIHSGSAAGGHYYAYIKSFKDGQWYSFNDQQVSKITYEDIKKTYGGSALGRGFYSSAYTSSTSAYMLMYRQINKYLNADVMQPVDFPAHLQRELTLEKEKEESERRQREIDKSTCKIKLYCFHPRDQHKMEAKLEIHKDKTLQEATEMARELLGLTSEVSTECCRLVKYDEYQDSLEKSFEGQEATPIATLLGGVKSTYTFDLLLETRRPEQTFQEYKPGGVTVKVLVVDLARGVVQPPVSVRAYHLQTVEEFKHTVDQTLGVPFENMRCVLERFHNDLRLLADPLRTLKAEGFFKSNKVFVECEGSSEELSVPYNKSQLCRLLDRYQHTISITCNLPSAKSVQDYLKTVKEHNSRHHGEDEAISETDSAFYSTDTNSKHSLAGAEDSFTQSSGSLVNPVHTTPTTTDSSFSGVDTAGLFVSTAAATAVVTITATTTVMASSSCRDTTSSELSSSTGGSWSSSVDSYLTVTNSSCCSSSSNPPTNIFSKSVAVSSVSDVAATTTCATTCVSSVSDPSHVIYSGPCKSDSTKDFLSQQSAGDSVQSWNNSLASPVMMPRQQGHDKQLQLEMPALCSRISSTLGNSHSDPSLFRTFRQHISDEDDAGNHSDDPSLSHHHGDNDTSLLRHSSHRLNGDSDNLPLLPHHHHGQNRPDDDDDDDYGGDNSDDSMRCLGSSGGNNSPEDTSAEFHLGLDTDLGEPCAPLQNDVEEEEEWWDLDRIEPAPQPKASFLDSNPLGINESRGVEGCDRNLNLERPTASILSPPPPPPPPPLPPPPSHSARARPMSEWSSGMSLKEGVLAATRKLQQEKERQQQQQQGEEEDEVEVEQAESDLDRYFHAIVQEALPTDDRTLQVSVDKRITFGAFKQRLEPYVGVASNLFKVYRVYSNNQEFESIRLSDPLSFFEDGKFNIKLGRALLPGEHRVKVFQLCVNESEPCKYLVETIFAKDMSVLQSKHMLLEEIRDQCALDVPLDRCRLRKKSWRNPSTVYLDSQVYDSDIPIYPNWEIFLEVLDGPEQFVDSKQLAVYVRQWHPETFVIGKFMEIVLSRKTVHELKEKISLVSGIPFEHVEFAKAKGTFPCEVSVLEVHSYLEWNPNATDLKDWPLYICEDGSIVFFRDGREKLKELSEEEKKEIQQKENKLSQQSVRVVCSTRKERALKIYTEEKPVKVALL